MFSSGAGSWAAARRVADECGTSDLFLVFADVKGNNPSPHAGEDEDNYRFLKEASADTGGTLVWLNEGRDIWQASRTSDISVIPAWPTRSLTARTSLCFRMREPHAPWAPPQSPGTRRVRLAVPRCGQHGHRGGDHQAVPGEGD